MCFLSRGSFLWGCCHFSSYRIQFHLLTIPPTWVSRCWTRFPVMTTKSCAIMSSKMILQMVHNLVNSLTLASVDSGDAHWSHDQAGRKVTNLQGRQGLPFCWKLKKNFCKITCIYLCKQPLSFPWAITKRKWYSSLTPFLCISATESLIFCSQLCPLCSFYLGTANRF